VCSNLCSETCSEVKRPQRSHRNREGGCELLNWFRIGKMAGCCADGNEPSDSTKSGEFLR
jgi:hypothetical protein